MTGERVLLAGVGIDPLTAAQVDERVVQGIAGGRAGIIVTPNLDHLRRLGRGDPMGVVYERAALVLADGTPLLWAARLAGTPLPERVPGSDLIGSLSATAARVDVPIALIGGAPGSAERAAVHLVERYPGLTVAGTACPPLRFEEDPVAVEALLERIVGWRPGIVFTGLGSPKQELFNDQLAERLPGAWLLGVGAAIDMVAGEVRRAPPWAHRTGLEWVFRLAQEPRRLARRYLLEDLPFAFTLFGSCLRQRVGRHGGTSEP